VHRLGGVALLHLVLYLLYLVAPWMSGPVSNSAFRSKRLIG